MYGYPYDVFAAQVFGSIIIRDLLKSNDLDLEPKFSHVRFDIENVHVYHKDLETLDRVELETLDDKSMIVYDLSEDTIERLKSEKFEDSNVSIVEDFRDSESEKQFVKEIDQTRNFGYADFLIYLAETYQDIERSISRHVEVDELLRSRLREILSRLEEDRYDRKNLIMKDDVLIYIHSLENSANRRRYEVSIYAK